MGSHNRLSELLVLDTDWLATLDYPPIELGFDLDISAEPDMGRNLSMYPRLLKGSNNSLTLATVHERLMTARIPAVTCCSNFCC